MSIWIWLSIDTVSTLYNQWNLPISIKIQNWEDLKKFMNQNKDTIIVIIYFIIMWIIFMRSKISIWVWDNKIINILLKLFFVPFTAIQTAIIIYAITSSNELFFVENIIKWANNFKENIIIYYSILLIPIFLILPWILVIFFSLDFSIKSNPQNNNWWKKNSLFSWWKKKTVENNTESEKWEEHH